MWLYPFAMLVMMSATFPPLFPVTILVGAVWCARALSHARRRRAAERAAIELKQTQAFLRAMRALP